jgi:hypothetical protein
VADLVNEFSWSRTRDNAFKECRRRYYYQYYGAWGGWEAGVDPLVRRLYVLKQLGTRQMWAGRLVHETVERALLALRDGHALSEAALIEDTVRQMRLEWKGSRDGIYREYPKRTGLFEHEYGVPIRDSEWQALRDHIVRCLRNFHRLPLLEDIKRTLTERWTHRGHRLLPFEGTRLFSAPDFGYWVPRPPPARGLEDLWQRRGAASSSAATRCTPSRCCAWIWRAWTCWRSISARQGHHAPVDEVSLDGARAHPSLGAGQKAYLKGPRAQYGRRGQFREAEDLRICRWCNFRAVCRPELPPFAAPEEAPVEA